MYEMRQIRRCAVLSTVILVVFFALTPAMAAENAECIKKVTVDDYSDRMAQIRPRISRWVTYKGHKYWYNSRGKMVKDAIIKLNGKFYCFDERGRLMTSRFIRKGTKVYFANSKGQFLTGWRKINKKQFYFSERGRALPGIRTIRKKKYCFSYRGEMLTGWQIVDGKKYYFNPKTGVMLKNRTIDGTKINFKGEAPLNKSELLELKCQEIVGQITNDSMSRSDKIRSCYNYMVSHSNFSYMTWRDYSYYDDWDVDYAYEMLTSHMGNCYNFAAAFAHLTKAAGCDATIVRGRIHGTRDGAGDGFTRHCWTIVDGLCYDTELAFVGEASVYGNGSYPLTCQINGYDTL